MKISKVINAVNIHARLLLLQFTGRVSIDVRVERARNMTFGKNLVVRENCRLAASGKSLVLGDDCYIDRNVLMSCHGGSIEVGKRCSFNANCVVYGPGGLKIGDDVRIAAGVVIVPANHGFSRVDIPIASQAMSKKGIVIEDDVWIGANCVILDGVRIGKGCVVGAGSIVTRDIPAYSIAVGSPARVIKQRQNQAALS